MVLLRHIVFNFNRICIIYTLVLSCIYAVQLIVSYLQIRMTMRKKPADDYIRYSDSDNLMPVTVIVPAHNEQENIVYNIRSLMKQNYPIYEIIVVNDGSTDNTHLLILEAFGMHEIECPIRISIQTKKTKAVYFSKDYPNLLYIDKENGGKADALNAGINASKYPLFVCLDADSLLEKDAILHLSAEFMKDTKTVVAGGFIRIANGSVIEDGEWKSFRLPDSSVERFQIVEYFRAFLSGRVSWGPSNALLVVSGAFGVFNKQAVIEIGGYKTGTIGEDMELIVRMHRHMKESRRAYSIKFSEDAICWTQGPSTLRDLRSQRRRWQIGLLDTLLLHKVMFLNPKYGTAGMLAIPYSWIFEFLGAIIEVLGYFIIPLSFVLGELSLYYFLLYLAVAIGLGIMISLGGLILEQTNNKGCISAKQIMTLTKYALLENFGYRQLITLFRVEGILRYKKYKNTWGRIRRAEFNK